jgi:hypothetical protein
MGKTSSEALVRGSGQPPSQKPKTSPSVRVPTASEVYQIIRQDTDCHQTILDRFRREGGITDRWSPDDVAAMAGAISAYEDLLDALMHSDRRRVLRDSLRELRRKLEEGGRQ